MSVEGASSREATRADHAPTAPVVRGAPVARAAPGPFGIVLTYQVVGVGLALTECAMRAVTNLAILRETYKHSFSVLVATGTALGACVALLAIARRALRAPPSAFHGSLVALAAYALGVNLFSGAWVSLQWFAPYGPVALALAALCATAVGGQLERRARTRPTWVWPSALLGLGVMLATGDALILPRSYPAFHVALLACAWVALAHAIIGSPWRPRFWTTSGRWRAFIVAALAVSLLGVWSKPPSPTRRVQWDRSPGYASRVYEQAHLWWWQVEGLHVVTRFAPAIKAWLRRDARLSEVRQPQALAVWGTIADQRQRTASATVADSARPHVILITVDALRADIAPRGRHWSALAERALSFERAYAPASSTQRSLPAIVSGRYDWRDQEGSVIEELVGAGYQTAFLSDRVAVDHLRYREQVWLTRVRTVATVEVAAGKWTSPRLVERARELFRAERAGAPLFAWVHFFDLHEWQHHFAGTEALRERYERVWQEQDAAVGALVAAAEAMLRDRPIVFVLTSDHGEYLGEDGRVAHRYWVDLPGTHVPLLVIAPGRDPARVARPVGLFDVAPTIAELAGLPDFEHEAVSLLRPAAEVRADRPLLMGGINEIAIIRGAHRLVLAPLLASVTLFDDSDIAAPRPVALEQYPLYERELLLPLLGSPIASAVGSPLNDP